MKTLTPEQLHENLDEYLDEILNTGIPIEIKIGEKKLRVVPVEPVDKFKNLTPMPGKIIGDPDELVNISWEHEINLDFQGED